MLRKQWLMLGQAMLYAAGVPNRDAMKNSPQVGVASVWWEGNPCKSVVICRPSLVHCGVANVRTACTVSPFVAYEIHACRQRALGSAV